MPGMQVPHAHMMLAAAWMFRLTGEARYEAAASSFHSRAREQQINPIVGWNNPLQDAKLLLLEANPNSEVTWLPGLQEWVDSQMFGDGDGVSYSRKGLWYVNDANWGALRNAANLANIAMRTAAMVDKFGTTPDDAHMVVWAHHARCLARQQMNYIMGSGGRSFVTGWGPKPPTRPHHRGASCAYVQKGEQCTGATWNNATRVFPNTLPGALVGGPNLYDEFSDSHLDYKQSEVSLDYNAALVSGALPPAYSCAALIQCLKKLPTNHRNNDR
jgi:endoglucanase